MTHEPLTNEADPSSGQLHIADIPEETKHQTILLQGHTEIAKMKIDVHKQMLYADPETLLSTLRQRHEVKRIITKCIICQIQSISHCGQKMDTIPEERVTPSPLFSHIGIDFVGPLYVKERASMKKTYVCIYLYLIPYGSTGANKQLDYTSFYKPLIARQAAEWSDNAKTFRAASNKIQKLYSKCQTQSQSMWDRLDQIRIESESEGSSGNSSLTVNMERWLVGTIL